MIVTLTGASGFIGSRVVHRLQSARHTVRALGRRAPQIPGVQFTEWDASRELAAEALAGAEAVIHLAGEPVAQRWTDEVQRRIRESRVVGTRSLIVALEKQAVKPRVLIASSAIGYYGDRGDELLTETSSPGRDFLAEVCVEWERASLAAVGLGIRTVVLRTGIVLGKDGGALKQMLGPFRAGVGGPAGSGKQWVSWIHVEDIADLIVFALEQQTLSGPVNGTAPEPVRNADFAHALGHALGRPSAIHTPAFALRLMFGKMADAVLSSQRVIPAAATAAGFRHRYPELTGAMAQILR